MLGWWRAYRLRQRAKRCHEPKSWLTFWREVRETGRYDESDFIKKARIRAKDEQENVVRVTLEMRRQKKIDLILERVRDSA